MTTLKDLRDTYTMPTDKDLAKALTKSTLLYLEREWKDLGQESDAYSKACKARDLAENAFIDRFGWDAKSWDALTLGTKPNGDGSWPNVEAPMQEFYEQLRNFASAHEYNCQDAMNNQENAEAIATMVDTALRVANKHTNEQAQVPLKDLAANYRLDPERLAEVTRALDNTSFALELMAASVPSDARTKDLSKRLRDLATEIDQAVKPRDKSAIAGRLYSELKELKTTYPELNPLYLAALHIDMVMNSSRAIENAEFYGHLREVKDELGKSAEESHTIAAKDHLSQSARPTRAAEM